MTEEKKTEVRPTDLTKPRDLYRIPVPAGFYVKLPPIKRDEKRIFKVAEKIFFRKKLFKKKMKKKNPSSSN